MDWIISKLRQLGDFGLAKVLPGLIILVVGILVIRIVLRIIKAALDKSKLEKAAHKLICSVAKVALFLLLGLIVASKLGIDVTGVVALASVLTLAVSLSVQTALTTLEAWYPCKNRTQRSSSLSARACAHIYPGKYCHRPQPAYNGNNAEGGKASRPCMSPSRKALCKC